MLGNFSCFCGLLFCWLFSKNFFFQNKNKKSFRNTTRVSNSLDPSQDQHYVGPDFGSNCLQRLSAEEKKTLLSDSNLESVNYKEQKSTIFRHGQNIPPDQTIKLLSLISKQPCLYIWVGFDLFTTIPAACGLFMNNSVFY